MKKKIIRIFLLIELLLFLLNICKVKTSYKENKEYLATISFTDSISLSNPDIVGSIKIAGSKYILVQGSDNDFYLHHDVNKQENEFGTIFLDYRCNLFTSDSCAIYGHSSNYYELPFNVIERYLDSSFWHSNKIIEISYYNELLTYEVVGVVNSYSDYVGDNVLYLQTCQPSQTGVLLLVAIKR